MSKQSKTLIAPKREVYGMGRKSKKEMIQIMKDNFWHPSTDEKSKWGEVKEEYDTFLDEISSDIDMYPNGRDLDAENYDD